MNTKPRTWWLVQLASVWLATAALAGCHSASDDVTGSSKSVGSVNLALSAGDTAIGSITYQISGNGLTKTGSIDVSPNGNVFTALISGIPAGSNYTITLTAKSTDGSLTCMGSAMFNISAGQTTSVNVGLQCPGAHKTGSVLVNGTLNVCAVADAAGASSTNISVGVPITLSGAGSDADNMPSAVTYAWSVVSGQATLQNATQANAQLTCTTAGSITVKLTVSDGDCGDSASLTLTCGSGGGAGSAAAGMSGGTAGSVASGGSGGSSAPNVCQQQASACHNVDTGDAMIHQCHTDGHAGNLSVCQGEHDACMQACGAALCTKLADICDSVDPGSGPLHDCHELGHDGDAAACFAGGASCYTQCTAAAGGSAGAGGAAGGAAGSSASGGTGGSSGGGTTAVTLNFKAVVGGQAFACGQTYTGQGSTNSTVTPTDFRFFVQSPALIKADGTEVPIQLDVRAPWQSASVALLDFENAAGNCSGEGTPETNTTITGTVPSGTYVGVSFVNGVPDTINHGDPATATDPLKTYANLTWGWLSGFRFVKAEVALSSSPGTGIGLVHVGSTGCTGTPSAGNVTCAKANRNKITLSNFNASTNTIVADFGAIFKGTDVTMDSECHSSGTVCPSMFSALGIDFNSGSPVSGQTVYSVQ